MRALRAEEEVSILYSELSRTRPNFSTSSVSPPNGPPPPPPHELSLQASLDPLPPLEPPTRDPLPSPAKLSFSQPWQTSLASQPPQKYLTLAPFDSTQQFYNESNRRPLPTLELSLPDHPTSMISAPTALLPPASSPTTPTAAAPSLPGPYPKAPETPKVLVQHSEEQNNFWAELNYAA